MNKETYARLSNWLFPERIAPTKEMIDEAYFDWISSGKSNSDEVLAQLVWLNYFDGMTIKFHLPDGSIHEERCSHSFDLFRVTELKNLVAPNAIKAQTNHPTWPNADGIWYNWENVD
jgi:hypothetical protein